MPLAPTLISPANASTLDLWLNGATLTFQFNGDLTNSNVVEAWLFVNYNGVLYQWLGPGKRFTSTGPFPSYTPSAYPSGPSGTNISIYIPASAWRKILTLGVGGPANLNWFASTYDGSYGYGTSGLSPTSGAWTINLSWPATPTNVVALPGDHSAIVSWNPPPVIAGHPVTSYTIDIFAGSSATVVATRTVTGSPPDADASIGGLVNRAPYSFAVSATTSLGTTPLSDQSDVIYPAPVISVYPPDVWSFAGISLQNDILRVRAIDGYSSVPPIRGTGFVRSAIPGEMFRGKIHGARVIGLELVLFSRDVPPDPIKIHENLDILAQAFNTQYQTEQPLVQFHPDGTVRTAQAHCVGWNPKSTDDHTGAVYVGIAEFLMSDPYFYEPQVVLLEQSGTFSIFNPGTVRTHNIVLTFHNDSAGAAPVTLTNTANNVQVGYTGAIAADPNPVVIDCYYFDVPAGAIGSVTHSGDLPFMVLEPGWNTLILSGTGASDVDVAYYPAYI